MWQEILAIDSKLNERRMVDAKELRPLYLKRRLQLLQAQHDQRERERQVNPDCDPDQFVMRNKKYMSLRVKLLKKQFSLPNDLVSLRSLSISPSIQSAAAVKSSDSSDGRRVSSSSASEPLADRSAYNGVHHVVELQSPLSPTSRLMFAHGEKDRFDQKANYLQASICILDFSRLFCATAKGQVLVCHLTPPFQQNTLMVTEANNPVSDFDLSESNELLAAAGIDGSFVVWDVTSGRELRRVQIGNDKRGGHVRACRFLPRNNNLIVCALSSGVLQVLNVSTGKFNTVSGSGGGGSALMLGKTTSVVLNSSGTLLWSGNDRGLIESFRIDGITGRLQVCLDFTTFFNVNKCLI